MMLDVVSEMRECIDAPKLGTPPRRDIICINKAWRVAVWSVSVGGVEDGNTLVFWLHRDEIYASCKENGSTLASIGSGG